MKFRFVHVGLLIALAVTLALWFTARQKESALTRTLAQATPPQQALPREALGDSPQAQALRRRMQFDRGVREFLRDASTLDEKQRIARARVLHMEIDRREQAGELAVDNAMTLRLGLINATWDDGNQRVVEARKVIDRQRKRVQAAEAAERARLEHAGRVQQYRQREAQIMAEAQRMTSFPEGMSREAYVHMRLKEVRGAIFPESLTPHPVPALPAAPPAR